ncbi:TPA_asm: P overlapped [Zea alphacytorhabdovirus 1]|nr:TPA_asm: P overlapped [Zea alphacytorhabdovirus 1]
MISELDPIFIFQLVSKYLSPPWLSWILLILSIYQILSLISKCLALARILWMILRMVSPLIRKLLLLFMKVIKSLCLILVHGVIMIVEKLKTRI